MNRTKKYIFKISLHVIFPLIIGCLIYMLGRNNTGLNHRLNFFHVHHNYSLTNNWWNEMLVFNVPDFCWDYSLASALFIWKEVNRVKINGFPLVVFILLVMSEVVQIFFPHSFTFDWLDIVAAIAAFLLSYGLNRL